MNNYMEEIKKIVEKYDGKCLSDKYKNNNTKLLFICKNEHHFNSTYKSLKKNIWCKQCKDDEKKILIKKKLDEYLLLKNGTCLEYNITDVTTSTAKIKCSEGHIWDFLICNLLRFNTWCVKCNRNPHIEKIKSRLNEYLKLKNGHYISGDIINMYSKITIKCENNHIWTTNLHDLLNHNHWCVKCLGIISLSFDELKIIVEKKGGDIISSSSEYKNNSSQITCKCRNGHEWKVIAKNIIHHRTWCPHCQFYIGEELTRNILNKLFDEKFVRCRPKWLDGLELDGFCENLKIAFEYDGLQHFKPVTFFNKKKSFEEIIETDKKKMKYVKEMM